MIRQVGDGTMVGGSVGDRSGGVRQVAKRKTHLGRKTHRKVEDASGGGRRIGRQKVHQKAEDALEAEAESKMERRGIRGFPLQLPHASALSRSVRLNLCLATNLRINII